MKWTKEQQKVIDLRNRNILVSAAAGSGKTAVLVERIITMLTKDHPPLDVDELLIVTFTDAAAAEMKERVLLAIERAIEENPENVHLQKQASLVHNAMITTIHKFCLSVIREHFHVIDLDPGFRVGEDGELTLLMQDVMEALLEEEYEKKEPAFLNFVERYASGRDDKKIEELIFNIFRYSRSYPNPGAWLQTSVDAYDLHSEEELQNSICGKKAEERIRKIAQDAVELLKEGIAICLEPSGPDVYRTTLEEELSSWNYFLESKNLLEMFEKIRGIKSEKLKPNRNKDVSKELAERVKDIRKETKELMSHIQKDYLFQGPKQMLEDLQYGKETVEELKILVERFAEKFAATKKSRNLIDFGDMEHFALQILTEEKDGIFYPSQSAKEYQKRFREIMIDEYQDSNLIQEAILTSVSKECQGIHNIFMVGDVKQSIYRFRLSRPDLFMGKYDTYSLEDGEKQRIDLHKNFRSRKEVLDSSNFVFRQIMTKELGGIAYDESAALYLGADYYKEATGNETEILVVDGDLKVESQEGIEETTKELEARAIAGKIKDLMKNHVVTDKATGEFRPVRYKDIVILTRSLAGWTDVFTKVLKREGIPTYAGSREGYFETWEIEAILNYLRVLDNPKQDIPLAAVLSSPMVGMTGGELAEIRSFQKEKTFSESVVAYLEQGPEGYVKEKLRMCFEKIRYFRDMIPYTAIHELLWKILDETGYGAMIAAMPGGLQRNANVEMLLEKAKDYEKTSYKGLFHFVRYIEQLKKYDVDYGEAEIADEEADVVRLMSIHKSKGLEFPIVFVAGMNKKFNKKDCMGELVIHPDIGLGVDCIDLEKRTKTPTFLKKVLQRDVELQTIGEELRILYVAMTRAKEKLILIGTLTNVEKKLEGYRNVTGTSEEPLSYFRISSANSYFDWVLPCYLRSFHQPCFGFVDTIQLEEMVKQEIAGAIEANAFKNRLLDFDTDCTYEKAFQEKIKEQFSYVYPHQEINQMKVKFTVSELKKQQMPEEEEGELLYKEEEMIPLLPKKLQKQDGLTGAGRGTAYHKIMELLDYSMEYDWEALEQALKIFLETDQISHEMYDCIWRKDIFQFLQTKIAHRMHQAAIQERLFKEQPFVLGVDATDIYPNAEDEILLVQGIIDAWFEEEDGLVVLDYKTDHVQTETELVERYSKQLDYYAKALERVTGKRVKEKIIYSFQLHQEIELS